LQGLARCALSEPARPTGQRTEQGNFTVALKPQHAGKQVQVPHAEELDPASDECCTRAPPAAQQK
jgi:hypothetical protein